MASEAVLSAQKITKSFDHNRALDNVTMTLKRGEIHAIIGENGAGKSTLMNIICGKLTPDAGTILWQGSPANFSAPSDALAAGVATVPQELIVCPHLTVAENVMLGAHRTRGLGVNWRETRRIASENLAILNSSIDPSKRMRDLSTARQQLVQIARATAADAKVMIFDEPTASLAEREAERLFAFIRAFREKGGSIFYISHRLNEVLELADRISVLRDGVLICEMDPAAATKDEMVRQMAGRPAPPIVARPAGQQRGEDEAPILRVTGLSRRDEFEDITFQLHRGEILGVSGLVGSGRTELAKCLFGATTPQRGRVEIEGHAVDYRRPSDAIAGGLVYLPEERKTEAIFAFLSVAENIVAARTRQVWRRLLHRLEEALCCSARLHKAPRYSRAVHQGADFLTERRQPAKGRPGAMAADELQDTGARRADTGNRRQRQGGNPDHPSRPDGFGPGDPLYFFGPSGIDRDFRQDPRDA